MGIEFPGSYCPTGEPHHYADIDYVDGGVVHQCLRCEKYLWLPANYDRAMVLGTLMDKLGKNAGYCKYIDRYRDAKIMIAKMQDLQKARKRIKDDKDFTKLVVSVMGEKDYDK